MPETNPGAITKASGTCPGIPQVDFQLMYDNTQKFMSLWRSYKPTIAKIQGHAVAGGSDIALCCDLVVMVEDAKIGRRARFRRTDRAPCSPLAGALVVLAAAGANSGTCA
jgi:acetyl-CoA carboxylase carboxyltransferase component